MDNTERSEEGRGGIIHQVKNKKEKNSLLQSEQEQRSKTQNAPILCRKHSHTITGERMGGGGWQETLQAFLKSEFTSSNNIYRIYIYVLYIYLYTYRKDIPQRKKIK